MQIHTAYHAPPCQRSSRYAKVPNLREATFKYLDRELAKKAPATRHLAELCAMRIDTLVGEVDIANFSAPDVDDVMWAMRGTPYMANRVKSLLSGVCKYAARRGWRQDANNPTKAVPSYREVARTEFLSAPQRERFIEAATKLASTREVAVAAACVCQLMLLAGLRLNEATRLAWTEVDLETGLLRLAPREKRGSNKSNDDRSRPLTDEVLRIIDAMPRRCQWIAPSPKTGRPYTDVRKPMRRICEVAGLPPDLRRHALRHSFGSACAEAGMSAAHVAVYMGHRDPNSAKRYMHLSAKGLRQDAGIVEAAIRGGAR